MGRNTKEVELFDEKLILSERIASDVLSFSEFAKHNSDEKTLGIALYSAALLLEHSLKSNKKELPVLYKFTIWQKLLKFFGLCSSYKLFLEEVKKVTAFNSKLLAGYLLEHLSQKELFDLVKTVYELEGIDLNKIQDNSEKKS